MQLSNIYLELNNLFRLEKIVKIISPEILLEKLLTKKTF
jgi:hypothetical protein